MTAPLNVEQLRARLLVRRWDALWMEVHGIAEPWALAVERFTAEMELADALAHQEVP